MAGLKVAGGTNETTRLTKKGKFFDYTLLIVVLFLVAFGLVMVYSTSSFSALQDTGDSAYYFKRQLLTSGIGLVAMTITAFISYKFWYKFGTFIYIAARALGKYFGARFGAKWMKMPETVQKYLGFTLLPHSGVSLVFTGIICATLEGGGESELAVIVKGTIAAAAVINEIIAVIMAKKGFEKAGEI